MLSFALLAIVIAVAVTLWAPHSHYDMTRAAFEVLPRWQRRKFAGLEERFFSEYSCLSDWYGGNRTGAKHRFAERYQVFVKGQPFHYLLSADIAENRELVVKGTAALMRKIAGRLRRGSYDEAARFMGVLAHAYQDQGTTIHGLEGPEGGNFVTVSRLIAPRPERPYDTAAVYLCEPQPVKVCIRGYRPRLLGTSVAEAAFGAYERYRDQLDFIRARIIPVIWHKMSGGERKALRLIAEMTDYNTRAVADVLYTTFCLACGRFTADGVKRLETVHLENLHPLAYRACVSVPYRFTPFIRDKCLTHPDRKPVPLRLRVRAGGRTVVRTFRRGLGTGCHWVNRIVYKLPKNVYSTFSVYAGQHAELAADGRAELKVRFAGKTFHASGPIGGRAAATRVEIGGIEKGGCLELISADRTGNWASSDNHIVWAEPTLKK